MHTLYTSISTLPRSQSARFPTLEGIAALVGATASFDSSIRRQGRGRERDRMTTVARIAGGIVGFGAVLAVAGSMDKAARTERTVELDDIRVSEPVERNVSAMRVKVDHRNQDGSIDVRVTHAWGTGFMPDQTGTVHHIERWSGPTSDDEFRLDRRYTDVKKYSTDGTWYASDVTTPVPIAERNGARNRMLGIGAGVAAVAVGSLGASLITRGAVASNLRNFGAAAIAVPGGLSLAFVLGTALTGGLSDASTIRRALSPSLDK